VLFYIDSIVVAAVLLSSSSSLWSNHYGSGSLLLHVNALSVKRNNNNKSTLTRELQNCFTPRQVLDRVGAANTKIDPRLSSLLLVRLSKMCMATCNKATTTTASTTPWSRQDKQLIQSISAVLVASTNEKNSNWSRCGWNQGCSCLVSPLSRFGI